MAKWYFSREQLNNSPSRKDGISLAEEKQLRRKSCLFIEALANKLKLPKLCTATAHVFFHRFFCRQSFKQHDRFIIAATCIFLAGKVEEAPRKLPDIIQAMHILRRKEHDPPTLDPKGEAFHKMREKILICERILLHTIAFDLCIEHPYKHLMDMIKIARTKFLKGVDKQKNQELAQAAWNFVNDSMQTDLCLQYPAPPIASACVYLACLYHKEIPQSPSPGQFHPWWRDLNINETALNSICSQILELYENNPEPRFSELRTEYKVPENRHSSRRSVEGPGSSKVVPMPSPTADIGSAVPQTTNGKHDGTESNNNPADDFGRGGERGSSHVRGELRKVAGGEIGADDLSSYHREKRIRTEAHP